MQRLTRIPLVDLSQQASGSYLESKDICAELKKRAKAMSASVFLIDERKR